MVTDNFAKKRPDGIFELNQDNIEAELWPLPVHQMFMVANRMTQHFVRMGLNTIGDIARLDFGDFKARMRRRMGRQSDIQAGYYWQTARGIDPSPVVSVGSGETDGEKSAGFGRQMTLSQPTSLTHEVAAAAHALFIKHWSGMPISHLSISLGQLSVDSVIQLTLFEDRSRAYRKERAIDEIKNRFGSDAIIHASSLLESESPAGERSRSEVTLNDQTRRTELIARLKAKA